MCADDVRGTQEPVTRMRRCQIARIGEQMTRPHRRRRVRGFAPSWIIYAYTSSGLASSQRIVCSISLGSLRIFHKLREIRGRRRSNQRLQRAWIHSGPRAAGESVGPSVSPRERAEACRACWRMASIDSRSISRNPWTISRRACRGTPGTSRGRERCRQNRLANQDLGLRSPAMKQERPGRRNPAPL